MSGYIKIYRAIREHWLWEDSQKLKWWIDIIMMANYKDNKKLFGTELKLIERGSFHTSESKLAARWEVSRKTVNGFLTLLEKDDMIEAKRSRYGTTIKVLNYNDYQEEKATSRTANVTEEVAEEEQEKNGKGNTTNKEKKGKKEKKSNNGQFTQPTLDEVRAYCKERNNNIDAEYFIDYYSTRGWELGKGRKVKDWKACIRTWENREKKYKQANLSNSNEDEPDPF